MAEDVSILSEIDEALRADKLQLIWARYGSALITFCVLSVLASAGSVFWKGHLHDLHERQTAMLANAVTVAQTGKDEDAIALFEKIESEGGPLAGLAGLRRAEALLRLKQDDKTFALYNDIATGKKDDAIASVRDFATLQATIMAHNRVPAENTPAPAGALSAGIFSDQVAELNALRAMKAGDTKSAASLLGGILADNNATLSQRTRPAELLDALKEKKK